MRLTRRDALAALATAGVAVGGAVLGVADDVSAPDADPSSPIDDAATETLVAVAEVVYPSEVDGIPAFVRIYLDGRLSADPDHRAGVAETVAELDATARDWFDAPVTDLDAETRDRLLRDLAADDADADPEGALSGRVRFYVVNELLYAFYVSPTGGRLVGIENPVGYPGGTESYRRASMPEEPDE